MRVSRESINDMTCSIQVVSRNCYLRPTVVHYPVQISNVSQTDSHGRASLGAQYATNGIRLTDDWLNQLIDNFMLNPGMSKTNTNDNSLFVNPTHDQVKGSKADKFLSLTDRDDSNIQGIAYAFSSLFGGRIWVFYLIGTGFIPNGDNLQLGAWWIPYH
jgi:hypothetical protein